MDRSAKKPGRIAAGNLLWYLRFVWKNSRILIGYVLLYSMAQTGVNLIQLFVAPVILRQVETGAPFSRLVMWIGLFALLLFIARSIRTYVIFSTDVSNFTPSALLMQDINWKANTTSWPNTINQKISDMREKAVDMARYSDEAPYWLFGVTRNLLSNIICFLVYLLMLANLDIVLALVTLATGVASYFATRRANNWRYEHRAEEGRHKARIAYIQRKAESVELAKDIRIYGLGKWISDITASTINLYEDFVAKAKAKQLMVDLISAALTILRNAIAYYVLVRAVLAGSISASAFVLYFSAASGFAQWIDEIFSGLGLMHRFERDLGTLREYLKYPEQFRFEGGEAIDASDGCELRLENVSYRYPEAEEDILHDVNLTIRPGEKLAIVGLNGAGKTTIVRLLCGLVDPTEGRVLLNGRDVRDFNREKYYELFSAVFQDSSIMETTLAENVANGLEDDIDRGRVEKCLCDAGLSEKLKELPNGVNTRLGRHVWPDAALLSGGEIQRLMLARALYKDGPILILDEPTAALDPIAENDIYTKYNQMTAKKTSVFISHRLASTRFCDRILFIADHGIAEEGTHAELIALGGRYAQLFEIQSRYYREGSEF